MVEVIRNLRATPESRSFARYVLFFASLSMIAMLAMVPKAEAHGTGIVKSCDPNTNCTNATFAVCDPKLGPCSSTLNPSKGPRSVTIQLSNFPTSTAVHVWFLSGNVDDPRKTDCTQAANAPGRTELSGSPVTTTSSGTASLNATLPPGNLGTGWSFGSNWICATTAAPGGNGTIGDQLFNVFTPI